MKLIFIKNFTQKLKVFNDCKSVGEGFKCEANKGLSLNGEPNIEEVMGKVKTNFNLEEVKEVLLVGNAGILKDIENYCNTNLKGVDVKWQ